MNHLYAEALAMRRAGKSYNEINKKFGIAKSTLSVWFKDMPLSAKAKKRLKGRVAIGTLNGLVKRNKMQTILARKRAKDIREKALREVGSMSNHSMLLIGAALYWAEGYKRVRIRGGVEITNHPIAFTNSDPEMIKVFVRFLKDVMKISEDRIMAYIRIFPHINEGEAVKYWSGVSGLPTDNFMKSSYVISKASQGVRPFNRLPFGTLQIHVSDTDQFNRLMGLLDGVKKLALKSKKT